MRRAQKQIGKIKIERPAQLQIYTGRGAWTWTCVRSATIAALLTAFAFGAGLLAHCSGEVRANPVRIAIRVQDDLYRPLVPITKNFKTCFKLGPDGSPFVSLCAEQTPSSTSPASQKSSPLPRSPAANIKRKKIP